MQSKSMDRFLYDIGLRHERVKLDSEGIFLIEGIFFVDLVKHFGQMLILDRLMPRYVTI